MELSIAIPITTLFKGLKPSELIQTKSVFHLVYKGKLANFTCENNLYLL
jgi:hypothetical protein